MADARENLSKKKAHEFLLDLQRRIGDSVSDRGYVERTVRSSAKKTKDGTGWEMAFINGFVLKNVHACLAQHQGEVSGGKAPRDLILAESRWAKEKNVGIACGTPVKNSGHPFYKVLGVRPETLYPRWQGEDPRRRKTTFAAVCPNFAILAPYRIVFECKYFNRPAAQPAVSQLVEGLYQAFFYRAMPSLPRAPQLEHGWDYEYSCFLAYDATANERLAKAWEGLRKIHHRFWDESNIFVMILTGHIGVPESS
jgi:hypothetical protein